jgi:hypothetical protein
LVSKNFLIMGVKLKNRSITRYIRNYKAKIEIKINYSPYFRISIDCLEVIINFTSHKACGQVIFKIQHGKDVIIFALANAVDYEGAGPADITISILRSDLKPERKFHEVKVLAMLEGNYESYQNGRFLEKIIKEDDISKTFMLLYEQLENMSVDMIRFYESSCKL